MTIAAGYRSGLLSGVRSGVNPSYGAVADTDGGVYVPSSAAQFTALGLDIPEALWLMQESSGNPADSIGAFPLTASGTVTYGNSEAGWTGKFLGTEDGVAGAFTSVSASLPDPSTTSFGVMLYAKVSTPAAIRSLIEAALQSARVRITTTPRVQGFLDPTLTAGTADPTGSVRPFYMQYNVAASDFTIYTDQERITITWAAQVGKSLAFGNAAAAMTARYRYGFLYAGAKAEKTHAQVKTMFQTLLWNPPWSP